jgi:hypothetical protein
MLQRSWVYLGATVGVIAPPSIIACNAVVFGIILWKAHATAFRCRDWDFASVIIAVWPYDQDGTEVALCAVQWAYNVARDLLPLTVTLSHLVPNSKLLDIRIVASEKNVTLLPKIPHR